MCKVTLRISFVGEVPFSVVPGLLHVLCERLHRLWFNKMTSLMWTSPKGKWQDNSFAEIFTLANYVCDDDDLLRMDEWWTRHRFGFFMLFASTNALTTHSSIWIYWHQQQETRPKFSWPPELGMNAVNLWCVLNRVQVQLAKWWYAVTIKHISIDDTFFYSTLNRFRSNDSR